VMCPAFLLSLHTMMCSPALILFSSYRNPRALPSFPTRRSSDLDLDDATDAAETLARADVLQDRLPLEFTHPVVRAAVYDELPPRSEEHTSELQSLAYLVCRLLLEKKKINKLSLVSAGHRSMHTA